MTRRLVNALDEADRMTDREAMLKALDLISRAALKGEATPERVQERLDRCINLAQGAIRYVNG